LTTARVELLEPSDGVATVGDLPFVVPNPHESPVSKRILATGYTERDFSEMIRHVVREGDVAVDVGANIGYFTSLLAQQVRPSGRVLALEPVPRARSYLEHNVRINSLDLVAVDDRAIADWEGEGEIDGSTFRLARKADADKRGALDVRVAKLGTILRDLEVSRIDFVKIDIEGGELRALEGMRDVLGRDRPLLAIETHPDFLPLYGDDVAGLERLFATLGYAQAYVDGHRLIAGPPERLEAARLLPTGALRTVLSARPLDWSPRQGSKVSLVDSGDATSLRFDISPGGKEYVIAGAQEGHEPPEDLGRWGLEPNRYTALRWEGTVSPGASCSAWLFQYDAQGRIATRSIQASDGVVEQPVVLDQRTRSAKFALRLAGTGTVSVRSLDLIQSVR
jgi:FkbM family methyltransferase